LNELHLSAYLELLNSISTCYLRTNHVSDKILLCIDNLRLNMDDLFSCWINCILLWFIM